MNNDELFDIRMKEKFKREVNKIPENINEEFDNISKFIKSKENDNMKKLNKKKKVGIVAASILCGSMLFMQTTFAKECIRSLSLNNMKIFESNDHKGKDKEIPKAAKGKVFDKNKNVIEKITLANDGDEMYNANGERVFDVDPDGTLITEKVRKERIEKNARENPNTNLIIKDTNELNRHTCFDVKYQLICQKSLNLIMLSYLKTKDLLFLKHLIKII